MHYWIYAATGGQTGTGCTAFKWEGQAPLAPPAGNGPGSSTFCRFAAVAYRTWAMSLLCCSLSKTVVLNLFAERSQIQTYKLVRGPH